ncbi:MAG TPA: GFA family protein [Woeseiaceae bacterium]|jgi:hypothetical protein|nr:GFA family protein [Woeseiaceae bacterium]
MTDRLTGRCFCGAVQFAVAGPESFACFCHCESCQRAAGAPVVAWATYGRDTFEITRGDLCWRHSSPGVTRGHCAICGTSVTYEHEQRAGEIDISVNCLDDPTAPVIRAHIWTEDKPPWYEIGDDLPVFERTVS